MDASYDVFGGHGALPLGKIVVITKNLTFSSDVVGTHTHDAWKGRAVPLAESLSMPLDVCRDW